MVIDSNYSVIPVIRDRSDVDDRRVLNKSTSVNIDNEEYTKNISLNHVGAFASNIWKLDKTIENLNNEGFTGEINFFDGSLSVEITNNYDYKVKNATLILYGKIALLGDFDKGETKQIDNCQFINIPFPDFDQISFHFILEKILMDILQMQELSHFQIRRCQILYFLIIPWRAAD